MGFFGSVGVITCVVIGCALGLIVTHIAGNIYGGIKGAYRIHAIKVRNGHKRSAHWKIIRLGLRGWVGNRYRDGFGTYWQVGGLRVPVDGRDPIDRDHFHGA